MAPVQLFVTCLVDGFAARAGAAAVEVLERFGCRVEFPVAQSCCGQPAHNAGLQEQARDMARQTIQVLQPTEGPVVVLSGSCADMMVNHIPDLLDGSELADAAAGVAGRVREFSQFLVEDLGVADAGIECHGCSYVYHPSCHGLRNLGLRSQPETLLDAIVGGVRLHARQPEQCCGFGGLFSLEMPDISAAMMDAKLDDIEDTGAEVVVGVDMSCLLHLEGGLRRRGSAMKVAHIAEILAGRI